MNAVAEGLKRKFESRDATVAVIGQGYVGLPLAMEVVEAGFRCIGVDVSQQKVDALNRGESYIFDIDSERLSEAVATGRYEATTDYARVADADAISICVPTPLRKTRDPDISYIQSAIDAMLPHLERPALIVLESTTYPGTTDEVIVTKLEENGQTIDEDVFVAFSPERVDPGNATYGLKNTPKVVGGVSDASTDLITAFYSQVVDTVHPCGSARAAEMVKLLENTFRAVNIALVNEMAIMSDRMGIDIWDVIEAAATKPFGFMPFTPGPGIGGHCIPLDPTYLSWKAKSFGFHNRFIELATDLNSNMPRFVVDKLARVLNQRGVSTKDAKVLILGMAYKPNINDLRESPALDIWKLLEQNWGANLAYHDPFIDEVGEIGASSIEINPDVIGGFDAVVVVTPHAKVDYDMVAANAQLVFDTRDAMDHGENIVKM